MTNTDDMIEVELYLEDEYISSYEEVSLAQLTELGEMVSQIRRQNLSGERHDH